MDRRTALKSGAAVGAALALAGCTEAALEAAKSQPPELDDRFSEEELDLPVEQRVEILAEGVERAADASVDDPDAFEEFLTDEGIAVEDLETETEEGEPLLSLTYVPAESADATLIATVGVVAGGYAALVESDTEYEELRVDLHEPDGRSFGEFEAFATWAEEYHAGALSAAEYGGEVLHTLQSKHE